MKKKKLILIVAIFIVLLGSLSITYTYYIIEENTKSIITFGNVKLKLVEKELSNNGDYIDIANDSIDITNITKLNRIVKVKNVGNNPFYLRIKFDINGTSNANDLIIIEPNENWQYKEGYYYYLNIVNPNEETNELMNEMMFDKQKIHEQLENNKFYLKIKAEAVQSEHNASDVTEVTNWPN